MRWYLLAVALVQAVGVGRVHVRALSPPMFLPVNNAQTERYTRIIFWRNAFGGAHEARWDALGRELAAHFDAHTGRALQPDHIEYLRCKLFGGDCESPAATLIGIVHFTLYISVHCTSTSVLKNDTKTSVYEYPYYWSHSVAQSNAL